MYKGNYILLQGSPASRLEGHPEFACNPYDAWFIPACSNARRRRHGLFGRGFRTAGNDLPRVVMDGSTPNTKTNKPTNHAKTRAKVFRGTRRLRRARNRIPAEG